MPHPPPPPPPPPPRPRPAPAPIHTKISVTHDSDIILYQVDSDLNHWGMYMYRTSIEMSDAEDIIRRN